MIKINDYAKVQVIPNCKLACTLLKLSAMHKINTIFCDMKYEA